MGYKVGHKRESVEKASKGLGKVGIPKGGQGSQAYRPKLHKKNKLV